MTAPRTVGESQHTWIGGISAGATAIVAGRAHRDAVTAAACSAVADEALRAVNAEITATRQRVRALDKRWLPALHDALSRLDLALEQVEHEDAARLQRGRESGTFGPTRE